MKRFLLSFALTFSFAEVLVVLPTAQAQSPPERTEKLQNDTIRLITERLNAHDKALLQLKRDQRRGDDSPRYDPPPRPTYNPQPNRRQAGWGDSRLWINDREVFNEEHAMIVLLSECLKYSSGEGPMPHLKIYDAVDEFKDEDFGEGAKFITIIRPNREKKDEDREKEEDRLKQNERSMRSALANPPRFNLTLGGTDPSRKGAVDWNKVRSTNKARSAWMEVDSNGKKIMVHLDQNGDRVITPLSK